MTTKEDRQFAEIKELWGKEPNDTSRLANAAVLFLKAAVEEESAEAKEAAAWMEELEAKLSVEQRDQALHLAYLIWKFLYEEEES